jgi:hypothetical protein
MKIEIKKYSTTYSNVLLNSEVVGALCSKGVLTFNKELTVQQMELIGAEVSKHQLCNVLSF